VTIKSQVQRPKHKTIEPRVTVQFVSTASVRVIMG